MEQTQTPKLILSSDEAERRIDERLEIADEISVLDISTLIELISVLKKFKSWDSYNALMLEAFFNTSQIASEYRKINLETVIASEASVENDYYAFADDLRSLRENVRRKSEWLKTLKQSLHLYEPLPKSGAPAEPKDTVFIVHIFNERLASDIAEIVRTSEMKPSIFQEKSDGGRNIADKIDSTLQKLASVIFVVTPEWQGQKMPEHDLALRKSWTNSVFLIGYSVAKLGDGNVIVVYSGAPMIPDDLRGVKYLNVLDTSDWKNEFNLFLKNFKV